MVAIAYQKTVMRMDPVLAERPEHSKKGLIEKARTDSEAFTYLFRLHYEEIFGYCARRLFDRTVAEDVTSTVFLKMVKHFPRFKGNLKQFRAWLFKIATNQINYHLRTSLRNRKLLKSAAEQFAGESEGHEDVNAERLAVLKEAILSLKPKYQDVIALRFFEGMSLAEVAEFLDRNPVTVRVQSIRAIRRIHKMISKAGFNKKT